MMRALLSAPTLLALALAGAIAAARADATDAKPGTTMQIRIDIEGTAITASLVDNATSRDFSDLPQRLSTDGAPDGIDPSVGDIAYYEPWGNFAIFYRDFGYSRGLIQLGTIDSGVDVLSGPDPLTATIELVEEQQ